MIISPARNQDTDKQGFYPTTAMQASKYITGHS